MRAEGPQARPAARRVVLWLGIGIAAVLAVALGASGPAGDDADPALPLERGARAPGAPEPRRTPARDDRQRASQLAAALAASLAAQAPRADLPAPGDDGLRAWASRAPAPGVLQATPETAPPPADVQIPFQWIGRWEQPAGEGRVPAPPMAILSSATSTWVVKAGDIVAVDWKIESIAADQIQLQYLPTAAARTLSLNPP
jgi:hypothetical protein